MEKTEGTNTCTHACMRIQFILLSDIIKYSMLTARTCDLAVSRLIGQQDDSYISVTLCFIKQMYLASLT